MSAPLYVALLHYPVYKKSGEVITTSVTPLDLHDIARSCLTYGVKRYYVVNPLPTMIYLSHRIADFWMSDYGANYNRTRTEAFSIMRVKAHLEECLLEIEAEQGAKPKLVATSARPHEQAISYPAFAQRLREEETPRLILLGTGYGLIREFVRRCDETLAPIEGVGEYNHLSVRSAAAIILDRLCGNRT